MILIYIYVYIYILSMKADVVLCQGNVLRDYLTDLFPILELGTSAKMRLAWCRASAVGICWYQLIAERMFSLGHRR